MTVFLLSSRCVRDHKLYQENTCGIQKHQCVVGESFAHGVKPRRRVSEFAICGTTGTTEEGEKVESPAILIQTLARVKHAATWLELWLSRMQGIFRLIVLAAWIETVIAR